MYNLISSVFFYKNKLAIGKNDGKDLLVNLKYDLKFFKQLTKHNVIIMGTKTFNSLPKLLEDRIHLILTRDRTLLKTTDKKLLKNLDNLSQAKIYVTMNDILRLKTKKTKYVIGGEQIFNLFLSEYSSLVDRVYFTQIKGYDVKEGEPDRFISLENFTDNYKLIAMSEKYTQGPITYRMLTFKNFHTSVSEEYKYIHLIRKVLKNGKYRTDRTGVGTISIFGHQMRFDISDSIPLLTTKSVPFNVIVEELLWFLRGDTDAKILQKKGVKIWDGNTSREFLDSRGLDYETGVLGPGYGWQIRNFGGKYSEKYSTFNLCKRKTGFDQLDYLEDLLKTDPYSRRILMCYWNPPDFKDTALVPCHFSFQLYVEEIDGEKYLSGHFTMRSSDNLAWSFNVVSYSILVYILAKRCGMKPKEIIYTAGDVHIYSSHLQAVEVHLKRTARPFPTLTVDDSIKTKSWEEITKDDFELWGYFPNPAIKMEMAV